MSLIAKPYTFSTGATIIAAEHNSNFDTLYNDYNGNIDNTNIKATAAIVDTKLDQITTASKVSGSAITGLASVPSSAGILSILNLPTGTSANQLVTMTSAGVLPAVSGVLLTNVATIQVVNTMVGATSSGSTAIAFDDNIPQNTAGDEYMTLAITPNSATNKLKIDVVLHFASSTAVQATAALFQDSTAGALAVGTLRNTGANNIDAIVFSHYMAAGTTANTTFKVRAGGDSGTFYFNGINTGRKFGGVLASSITISEEK